MSAAVPAGAPYFLVERLPVVGAYRLDGPEGRHASVVRRTRVGETVILADGKGGVARATAQAVGRGTVDLLVGPTVQLGRPALLVTVVQALPKGDRNDLAVDLATEAGADVLVPWAASRCVARWDADRAARGTDRWRTVAREAAKQSRRAFLPVVAPHAQTPAVVELIAASTATVVLHEAGATPITRAQLPVQGNLVLVVGPEGGISPQELALFEGAGAQVVRLGHEVLRTSTAAAVALGALGVLTGRWDESRATAGTEIGGDGSVTTAGGR